MKLTLAPSPAPAARRAAPLVLALLAMILPAAAQTETAYDVPEHLQDFWKRYREAKLEGDEEGMDKAVRSHRTQAEDTLDLFLNDLGRREDYELQSEVRGLAWSLDRVHGSERFIERVRRVIEMEMPDRARRRIGVTQYWDAIELAQTAQKERTSDAWEQATRGYTSCLAIFEAIGDGEYAVLCLSELARIEAARNRLSEQVGYLERLVAVGETLPYREPIVTEARQELERLAASGASGPKGGGGAAGGTTPADVSRGLESYAEGSVEQVIALDFEFAKKGLSVELPTLYPVEQYQLWVQTYVDGQGPTAWDRQRENQVILQPGAARWNLLRDGIAKFLIDADGDGKGDVEFSPSTSPQLVEVPLGEKRTYPLMVATLSDRERLFGVDANYMPNESQGRLRFSLASWLEGKVAGDTWKVYDANMDGSWGPLVQHNDDLVTFYDEDLPMSWWEPDAVLVGRAKRAVPLSTVMVLDDGLYRTTVESAERRVRVRKLDLPTGAVALDAELATPLASLVAREVGGILPGAVFELVPERKGGTVEMPVGSYQICQGSVEKGKKTSMDLARVYTGTSSVFDVRPGETTTLALGAPFTLTFETRVEGQEMVLDTRSLRCFGRGGEEYAMLFDEALQPVVQVEDAEGRSVEKGEKLRMTSMEEWQQNTGQDNILWFPAEYRVELPRGASKLRMRLSQKEHGLLGGPFASEWIP